MSKNTKLIEEFKADIAELLENTNAYCRCETPDGVRRKNNEGGIEYICNSCDREIEWGNPPFESELL
jgi:hypothetical protein